MNAAQWKQKLSPSVWNRLANRFADTVSDPEEAIANLLTEACELGFTFPEHAVIINERGTVLMSASGRAAMTAEGLIRYHATLGNGFLLLRLEQLLRACSTTQQLTRLQEIVAMYEERCRTDSAEMLPEPACRVFAGGDKAPEAINPVRLIDWLIKESPPPDPSARHVAHADGPGDAVR